MSIRTTTTATHTPAGMESPAESDETLLPDVWWGEHGIDALIWADPAPYRRPEEPSDKEQGA